MKKTWKQIHLIHDGDQFFTELLSELRRAQKSITVEFYIFEVDALTELFLSELAAAVRRGCEVQLLVDGVGSLTYTETLTKRCREDGILFRVYHPVPNFFQWLARLPEALFSKAPNIFRWVNRRNHRKIIVVDRKVAFLGSYNMTKVHSPKMCGNKAWRDSAVRLEGDAIEGLVAAFDLAWTFARKRAMFPVHSYFVKDKMHQITRWHHLVRLNANDRIRRFLYKDLCRRISQAKKEVLVVTAYFLPKRALAKALANAARRGVHVKLVIPGPTDVPLVKWAAYQLPYKLQKQGVEIYEYQPTVLHAKYMKIDDWSTLGSLNLNHRSLLHDLEVEAVFEDEESLQNLAEQFRKDVENSKILDSHHFESYTWFENQFAKMLFKLRYWL